MPGSVTNSGYVGTLPWSLSTHFTEDREWKALVSEYKDGSSQRLEQVSTSRKTYSFSKRLTQVDVIANGVTIPAQMPILRAFYMAHIGIPFKFYQVKADYDAANANFKIVRFDGAWSEEFALGRSNVNIVLVEVA